MKLTSPSEIKKIVEENKFPIRKKYGQNFLVDENILNKIIEAASIDHQDTVLEIGPGLGTMTFVLAEHAKSVTTIEIDAMLIPILEKHFSDYQNIKLIHGDALKTDWSALFSKDEEVTVVANLPYYITSPLIEEMLKAPFVLKKMVILVQKEVGERLVAKPGTESYGSLSVFVQSGARVEWICGVPRTVFYPAPKVDSAVISITPSPDLQSSIDSQEMLELTSRAIFGQRRKTLQNALLKSPHWKLTQEELVMIFKGLEYSSSLRGEVLSPDQIVELSNRIFQVKKDKIEIKTNLLH